MLPNLAFAGAEPIQEQKADILFFQEILKYIEDRHPFDIEEDTLIKGGLKGMLQAVDRKSVV